MEKRQVVAEGGRRPEIQVCSEPGIAGVAAALQPRSDREFPMRRLPIVEQVGAVVYDSVTDYIRRAMSQANAATAS